MEVDKSIRNTDLRCQLIPLDAKAAVENLWSVHIIFFHHCIIPSLLATVRSSQEKLSILHIHAKTLIISKACDHILEWIRIRFLAYNYNVSGIHP